jgi:hypothetical protein
MNGDKKLRLQEHNRRVRAAVEHIPPGLRESFKAIAYRADVDTSTDEGCTVHDIAMSTIAKMAKRGGYARSERQLWKDLALFVRHHIMKRTPGERIGRKQAPTTIEVSFTARLPDPDELAYRERVFAEQLAWEKSWHGETTSTARRPTSTGELPEAAPVVTDCSHDKLSRVYHNDFTGAPYRQCERCGEVIDTVHSDIPEVSCTNR